MRILAPASAIALLAALAGCGSDPPSDPTPNDRRTQQSPAANVAGDQLVARALPRIAHRGGRFLRHPRVVTVSFAGDERQLIARLTRFGNTITRTQWWRAVTEGYCTKAEGCIGDGRPGGHVQLDERLPATIIDVDVGELLARQARAGRLGPIDREVLLLVYLPARVTLADAFVPRYCGGGPRGLHRSLRLERLTIPYAVVPRCGGEAQLTATASQEILEATTNPQPAARGFAFERSSANLAFTAAGVEPVDPCGLITNDRHTTVQSGFVVHRAWSNRAAEKGRDPCVPASPHTPYLALVPRQPAIRLMNPGDTATITLDARADRRIPAWTAKPIELTGPGDRPRYLDLELSHSTIAAGQTAQLTITLRKRPPARLCIAGVASTLRGHTDVWPVTVVTR